MHAGLSSRFEEQCDSFSKSLQFAAAKCLRLGNLQKKKKVWEGISCKQKRLKDMGADVAQVSRVIVFCCKRNGKAVGLL